MTYIGHFPIPQIPPYLALLQVKEENQQSITLAWTIIPNKNPIIPASAWDCLIPTTYIKVLVINSCFLSVPYDVQVFCLFF